MGADNAVGLALKQQLNGQIAHLSGVDSVSAGGGAAPLDVAQNGDPGIQIDGFLDSGRDLRGLAGALGHHDHVVGEAVEPGLTNLLDDVLFEINGLLGDQNGGSAAGQTHIHGKVARVAAHDLHNGAALVGLHGVPQLIDALDGRVGGGVETDAVVGAADVVIDGAGNADDVDAVLAQGQSAPEGAVAADGDDAVQSKEFAGGDSLALALLGHEFRAAGGIEDGAATVDGVGHALLVQTDDVAVDQAVPAPADAVALHSVVQCGTYNRADAGVHAGGIAAAGQHADSSNAHNRTS